MRVVGTAALVSMVIACARPSFALEPSGDQVGGGFLTAVEREDNGTLTYGDVSTSGSTVTITDIKVDYTSESGSGTALLGRTAIANGPLQAGVLTADSPSIEDLKMDEQDQKTNPSIDRVLPNDPAIPH